MGGIENDSKVSEVGQISKVVADLSSFSFGDVALSKVQDKFSVWLDHGVSEQGDFPGVLNVKDDSLGGFEQMSETSALVLNAFNQGVQTSLPQSKDRFLLGERRLVSTNSFNLLLVEVFGSLS